MNHYTISNLRAFVRVAESRSLSEAAKSLFMSRQGLINIINTLETDAGAPLFVKGKRPMPLTPVGECLYKNAVDVLAAYDKLQIQMSYFKLEENFPVTMGFSDSIFPNLFSDFGNVFRAYLNSHSKADILWSIAKNHQIIEYVQSGNLDCGIILSMTGTYRNCECIPLKSYPLCLTMSKNHPLAGYSSLTPSQLSPYPCITYDTLDVSFPMFANFQGDYRNKLNHIIMPQPASAYKLLNNANYIMLNSMTVDISRYPNLCSIPLPKYYWYLFFIGNSSIYKIKGLQNISDYLALNLSNKEGKPV